MIIFLIYIMGVIILMGSLLYVQIEAREYLTLEDILMTFLVGLFSWLGIFICLYIKFENKVIYKKKR